MPSITRRELIKRFKTLGFKGPFSGGRHQFMIKGQLKIRIPNPHGNREISVGLLKEILRQSGISKAAWDELDSGKQDNSNN